MFLVGFYWRMLKLHGKSLSATSGQLWFVIVSVLLDILVSLLVIHAVFLHTTVLANWSQGEVLFLYGFWYMGFSFYHTFMNGVQDIPRHLVTGTLDNILTRPIPPLLYLTSMKVSPYGITSIIGGLIILSVGSIVDNFPWTAVKVFLIVVFVISTNLINYAIQVLLACLSFVLGPTNNLFMIFWNLVNLASFPLSIFSSTTRGLLTLLTIAFLSYFPVSYLLDKPDAQIGLLTPLVAIVCLAISWFSWKKGLESYQSSGT